MIYDLVFEGGGAKGMVFVGAMQAFEAAGHSYGRLLGTSAGAITALFLAVGYSPQEMLAALDERVNDQPVYASFMGPPPAFSDEAVATSATLAMLRRIDMPGVPNALRVEDKIDRWLAKTLLAQFSNLFFFIERGGWYSADKFLAWLRRKLDEGQFQGQPRRFSRMTMKEFAEATGRDLSLVTSDTSAERMMVMNHRTTPDLPVVWAVRMSMSIPLVWPEVEWQAEWGSYRGQPLTGHRMVDGGVLSNFPIELLISDDVHITAVMGDKVSEAVLGLLIDESKEVADAPVSSATESAGSFDVGQLQLVQRLNRLINTATGAHDKMVIETFDKLVARLPAKGYGTTEFDMSDARRDALIAAGRVEMERYLAQRAAEREEVELLGMAFEGGVEPEAELDVAAHATKVATSILDW